MHCCAGAIPPGGLRYASPVMRSVRRWLLAPGIAVPVLGAACTGTAAAAPAPTVGAGSLVRGAPLGWGCTVGVVEPPYAITSGYCFSAHPSKRGTPVWGELGDTRPIGTLVYASTTPGTDYAVIRLHAATRTTRTPVAVPPPPGARACKLGRVSGWTCGTLHATPGGGMAFSGGAMAGDGGAGIWYRGHVVALLRGDTPVTTLPLFAHVPGGQAPSTTLLAVSQALRSAR